MKRKFMAATALLTLMLSVSCAPASVPQGGATTGGEQAKPGSQGEKLVDNDLLAPNVPRKKGGLMTLAISEAPKTLDPYFSSGVAMNHIGRPLYQTLLEVNQPTPGPKPGVGEVAAFLAEKWSMPDDKTVIFNLRKGVKFTNGETMTADDVLFSLEYARDPKNNFSSRTSFRTIDKIEKVDDYTVRVTLNQIDPDILTRFTSGLYILSKKFFDGGGDPKATAVGTGPFRNVKMDTNSESISVRREDYWDPGKPYLDGIRHIAGLERSAILAAWATKKVDYYNVTDKVQFDEFKRQQPDEKHWIFYTDYNYGWYPNLNNPILKDKRVRQALQLTIDRQEINDSVAFGIGQISAPGDAGFLGDAGMSDEELFKMPGWRQPKTEDIATAKRLMQEAGYANGFKVTGVYISTYTTVPQIAELISNQWKNALGVTLELKGLDTALWSEAVEKKGDFDLSMGNTRITSNPDTNMTNYWYSKGAFNKAAINFPQLDAVIEKQKTIVDAKERRKVWAQMAKVVQDEYLYLPSLDAAYFGILQPWVNGIYPNFSAQPWLRKPYEVWFDTAKLPADRAKSDQDILKKATGS